MLISDIYISLYIYIDKRAEKGLLLEFIFTYIYLYIYIYIFRPWNVRGAWRRLARGSRSVPGRLPLFTRKDRYDVRIEVLKTSELTFCKATLTYSRRGPPIGETTIERRGPRTVCTRTVTTSYQKETLRHQN